MAKVEVYGTIKHFSMFANADRGDNMAVAYVIYENKEVGKAAMEGLGDEFEIAGSTGKAQFQHNKFWPRWTRSVYVANLPFGVDKEEVAEFFTSFGEVLAVRMPLNESHGTTKGYCWVEFLERSAFYSALEADGE